MYVRRLLPDDLAEVTGLEQALNSGWSRGAVHEELDRPRGIQLVAYEDYGNAIVGWCCGLRVGEEAELLRISVTRSKRKCGVASTLLARFEKECREQKVASIFLEVADKNLAAKHLYEKFDYKQVSRRKAYYSRPKSDALVMNKILSRESPEKD